MSDTIDDRERARRMLKVLFKTSLPDHRRTELETIADRGDCDAILNYVHARLKDTDWQGSAKDARGDCSIESLYEDILWVYRGGRASFAD